MAANKTFDDLLNYYSGDISSELAFGFQLNEAISTIRAADLRFRHLAEIEEGGSGHVHEGSYNGSTVAVKVLLNTPQNVENQAMIEQEIMFLSNLDHPKIVQFLGALVEDSCVIIVMEYLSGGSLREYLDNEQNNPDMGTKLDWAISISQTMEYLHHQRIVHKDLKPGNLAFSGEILKLLDFGISESEYMERNGEGTPKYAAPEILAKGTYNCKADVYSFAIILWELLKCKEPFEGMDTLYLTAHVHDGKRLSLDGIPEGFKSLLVKCWDADNEAQPDFRSITADLRLLRETI